MRSVRLLSVGTAGCALFMATNQCLVTHARSLLVDKGAFFYTPEMTWSRSALSSFHGLDLFLSGCELYFD